MNRSSGDGSTPHRPICLSIGLSIGFDISVRLHYFIGSRKNMGSIKKRRKAKINKHKRRKKLRANRHKKRTWQK